MPWTETARREYERRAPPSATDMTDREWALIARFMPAPRPVGRPRKTDLREVVNALLYMGATGSLSHDCGPLHAANIVLPIDPESSMH